MAEPVRFYFDFSSPYGYLGANAIEEIAGRHGRAVDLRPILLGAVMRETGARPLSDVPLKGEYMNHDVPRAARAMGVPFAWPDPFPIPTQAAARATYWAKDRDEAGAAALAKALYAAFFVAGRDISNAETVVEVAAGLGHDGAALSAALQEPAIKQRLKDETAAAAACGVFGSPFFIVDGEAFWGHDRLAEVARWLETGGW